MLILAELLSTIGMVLLAGEYVQGTSKWFNTALERFIINIFPNRILLILGNPTTVTSGIVRADMSYIISFIFVPFFILFSMIGMFHQTTSNDLAVIMTDELRIATTSQNASERQQASDAYNAIFEQLKECVPLMDSADAKSTDPAKVREAKTAFDGCWKKWQLKRRFDVRMSVFERLQILALSDPLQFIFPAFAIVVALCVIFYLLSLGLLLSRLYSRLNHIESFVLPVGFGFTAIGQSIKLVLGLFSTNGG